MMNPPRRLENRVAIVTGGASGIGHAIVLHFLQEGARVVLADMNCQTGMAVLQAIELKGNGDPIRFFECDVSQEADVARLVQFAVQEFGRLDCMVNNAGTGGATNPLVKTSVEDWDRTQAILLRGVFLGIKHAAKVMIRQGEGGAIVNMASIAGLTGGAGGAAYSTAKAGVINLTRCAAIQLGQYRIRCNSVSPGTILTPLLLRGADPETMREAACAFQPWPEPGLPEHVAPVVAFLASDAAEFMTGENVLVDGGVAAGAPFLYSGQHPLGNAIAERMKATGVQSFDAGSTQVQPQSDLASPVADIPPKTVLITGVGRGLGRAMTDKLVQLGHTVIGCTRSQAVVDELRARYGPPHRFDSVDVADDGRVRAWAESVVAERPAPDLLMNNAAATNRNLQIWRLSPEEFAQVINVNLLGTVNVLRNFLPAMLRRKSGIVVNFSSGWGREAAPNVGPYCASKWAIEGLTQVLAKELPPGMAAVSLHPGIVNTDSLKKAFGARAEEYPSPAEWAEVAAPYLLRIRPQDNGRALSVPGMTTYRGPRSSRVAVD